MRLGVGELTMHYRRHVDGGGRQSIECRAVHGCITAVLEDVTCANCRAVAARADTLAAECGCHNGHVHRATAQVQLENEKRL